MAQRKKSGQTNTKRSGRTKQPSQPQNQQQSTGFRYEIVLIAAFCPYLDNVWKIAMFSLLFVESLNVAKS